MTSTNVQVEAWASRPLSTGEAVRAFYHMNDHPNGYRYVQRPMHAPEGTPEAVGKVGLSTGWMPATVAEDWNPGQTNSGRDDRVLVKLHGHFADVYNMDPEPVKGMYWRVSRSLVRPMGTGQAKVELSLCVVRWWDYWNRNNRKSRTHNVANEEMLLDVLEGPHSPHATFGGTGAYEVHSAFIKTSEDLEAIGSSMAQAMRGQRKAALYFLWPTQRPAVERRQAGCVSEPSLLSLMQRMESLGVPSCWPHGSPLYRELSGKLWVPRVSRGRPELRVPPTISVDVARWKADAEGTVKDIIAELQTMGDQTRSSVEDASYRGVVKLGFSWMGEDVLPFTGPTGLGKALSQLLEDAKPDAICLVQQRVEDVTCEMRVICCRDLASGPEAVKTELVRMKLRPPRHVDDNTFALTSHLTINSAEALQLAFHGDAKAMDAAESEVFRLAHLWLAWLRDEGFGVPSACRFDFLVSVPKVKVEGVLRPEVFTVELCECGGSLCGLSHHARTAATLNECCATGVVDFKYTWESHKQLPLSARLEEVRQSAAIVEQDWQNGLCIKDSQGNDQEMSATLEETQFPVTVRYASSSAFKPLPLPAFAKEEPETTVAAPARGSRSSASASSAGGGVLAKWFNGRATTSKISVALVILALILRRLLRHR